jgi:hypothetical protein
MFWATFWPLFSANSSGHPAQELEIRGVSFQLSTDQGDQIGRFFASWAIIYFEQFYEKYQILAYKFPP